ncbi:uncharacterized protein METZ01_LOCUS325725, partial [marine metagenome]
MHAIRVSHGIGFITKIQQGAGDAPCYIEESEVPNLLCGFVEAVGQLGGEFIQHAWIIPIQFNELSISQFCNFTIC